MIIRRVEVYRWTMYTHEKKTRKYNVSSARSTMQMTITICSSGTFGFWEERKSAAHVIDTLACTDQAMLG